MNAKRTFKVLSIDAWAEGESSWTWNAWYNVPYAFPAELIDDDRAILGWFVEQCLIKDTIGIAEIQDDQYRGTACFII